MILVTHSEVRIEAPAARVWPYILEPNSWKQGVALQHMQGPVGEVGETFTAALPGSLQPQYYVQNVELEAPRRRTVKLAGVEGLLLGFASWALCESDGTTVVTYDVYIEYPAPEESHRQLQVSEAQQYLARFHEELLQLKKLVEAG